MWAFPFVLMAISTPASRCVCESHVSKVPSNIPNVPLFLATEGQMSAMIAVRDWGDSLGPVADWPPSLKVIVGFLLRSAVPMVLLWGKDGIMIYNDAYSAFAGGRHPELLGKKVREGWPEVADFNDNVMRVGLAGGTLAYKDQELTLQRTGKPEQVWMNLDYSPVIDESGKPGGVIAIVVETTERVLAERRQAHAVARQRRQFEQAPGFIIVMHGPEHEVEFVNDTHRRVFGSDDRTGRTIREAFPSLEGQGFFELLDKVYETGEEFVAQGAPVRYRRSPAEAEQTRYLTFIYAPITDENGKIVGVFCDGFDVTEAHLAQIALRNSEASLRELNANLERKIVERSQARGLTWQVTPDLMGALNSQGYFETSNPAWQTILGWSEQEIARMSIFELLHPDDVERTRAGFELTQIGQPAIRFPNRYRCKDGGYRWISWVGVPEEGMVYCVGRDITDEVAAQEKLLEAQEALRQAQKMEAVGQLTGGIAHDFNNLLQGISGSLDRVQHRIAQGRIGDIDRFVKSAIDSANRAAALTHRLLAFSRRQTLDPRPTDMNKLIGGMEDLIRRTMGPGVTIEVVGAVSLWPTRIDASQLENSLLNLCINARDAMPRGGHLTIETANKWMDVHAARERDLVPGQYVSLCVTDTGTGMAQDVIERAFDPFYTTKPIGQGTGLGLSMIYGFVRQSGGQVRVYSELGKGTTMCLYFPRHIGDLEDEQKIEEALVGETGSGEVVLVVDDEATVRMLIVEVLTEAGYRALEAADGSAALKILQSNARVDLLITDVGLPGGMNGRQVADAGRALRNGLKVLFITGFAENAAVGSGHLGHGMEILTKPFQMTALGNRVREMLEG
jgi:PAS domain S-box-containing protein